MDCLIHGSGKESGMTERLLWSLSLGGTEDKNLLADAGYKDSIPGLGRFYMPWGNKAHGPQLLKPTNLEPTRGSY